MHFGITFSSNVFLWYNFVNSFNFIICSKLYMQVYILSLLVLCNDTSWNLWLGNCQWKSLPQELLQVQPWRVCDKLIQLHSAWRPTLLQAPPHSTHQGKRQLQPARGWQQVLLLILQLWCLDMLIWRMHFYWYLIDFLLWFFFCHFYFDFLVWEWMRWGRW